MSSASADLFSGLLKNVSRSFYLTLRVLPARIRQPIGLAYLLARASDTIADTEAISPEQRLRVLEEFGSAIQHGGKLPSALNDLAKSQSTGFERKLLQRLEEALLVLAQFTRQDQERVRVVLATIVSGQALDLQRFGHADRDHIAALQNDAELDDYTYRVAGCVGEFWTTMCRGHVFPQAPLDDAALFRDGVRFGKGLQLVNILRDLPADLRIGRSYLPEDALHRAGLQPSDLLDPANQERFRPVYLHYIELAEAHLKAGWAYTNQLPFRAIRVRLACAWPVLIGVKTLAKLRTGVVLDPARRIKISRQEVRQILARSIFWYPWPVRWRRILDS